MLAEHGNISVGIDLGRDYSQIAFCSKSDRAPLMVMQSEEKKEEKVDEDFLDAIISDNDSYRIYLEQDSEKEGENQ